ncbi:MAG: hypothetical protein EXR55_04345 [Dehalococcoidia bacterium]|nr:hypothetical protein [Dehalococcoidia bacterium]
MIQTSCQYWDCRWPISPNHFLCLEHYDDFQDGFINQCPKCGRYKDSDYDLCLDCYRGRPVSRRIPASSTTSTPKRAPTPRRYTPEHSPAWEAGDAAAASFFVYILKLAKGEFYVGQTRDLLARISEHKDGREGATAGKAPRLQ